MIGNLKIVENGHTVIVRVPISIRRAGCALLGAPNARDDNTPL